MTKKEEYVCDLPIKIYNIKDLLKLPYNHVFDNATFFIASNNHKFHTFHYKLPY